MRIIIAPAKKMNTDLDSFAPEGLPKFLDRTERLKAALQAMSPKQLQLRQMVFADARGQLQLLRPSCAQQ